MVSYESINRRLGFDYMEYMHKYYKEHRFEYDDLSNEPWTLLTDEECDFLERDWKEKGYLNI